MRLLSGLPSPDQYRETGAGHLPSCFDVTGLLTGTVAAVGLELAQLRQALGLTPGAVTVDRRLASLWAAHSLRPIGWEMPDLWDPIAGVYETADGWIRLHTNLPHHRAAALSVLQCESTRDAVATAVARWAGTELETAIVEQGGVSAFMRTRAEWLDHPQGRAVAEEPLIHWSPPARVYPAQLDRDPGAPPGWVARPGPDPRLSRSCGDTDTGGAGRAGATDRPARMGRTRRDPRDHSGQTQGISGPENP